MPLYTYHSDDAQCQGVCTSSSNHLCMPNRETMIENDRVDVLIAQQDPNYPILIQAKLVGHISLNECRLMRMNQMNWDSNRRNLTEKAVGRLRE